MYKILCTGRACYSFIIFAADIDEHMSFVEFSPKKRAAMFFFATRFFYMLGNCIRLRDEHVAYLRMSTVPNARLACFFIDEETVSGFETNISLPTTCPRCPMHAWRAFLQKNGYPFHSRYKRINRGFSGFSQIYTDSTANKKSAIIRVNPLNPRLIFLFGIHEAILRESSR